MPARVITESDLELLIRKHAPANIGRKARDDLLRELNSAISQFQFRQSYATAPTPAQFRKKFDDIRGALKRLKIKLPSVGQHDPMFNYICRRGEAYAAAHGPHPNIDPRKLPAFGDPSDVKTGIPETIDFNSARRLRELIESVDQVSHWMETYDENQVPKSAWSRLEKRHGRTHSRELWLIGKELPRIFAKYFEYLKGDRGIKESGSRRDRFVVDVLRYAKIRTSKGKLYDVDTVEKYRRRAARMRGGFELTTDKLD
jgi:hypothetical protein